MDISKPAMVAEVAALFEAYEQALVDRDVAVLDRTFWDSPFTVRYGMTENGYGFKEIHAHRLAARTHKLGTKERRIRLETLTLGDDLATVNLEFKVRGRDATGRQSRPGCASLRLRSRRAGGKWSRRTSRSCRQPRPEMTRLGT